MRSMTGYGAGEAALGGGRLFLELRALNHRFVEVRVRMPPELVDQTPYLEQLLRERLERGRIDATVRLSGAALPAAQFSADRARSLHTALSRLRDELLPGSEVSIATLANFPELLLEPAVADVEGVRAALAGALEQALGQLAAMRETEGAALGRDLSARLAQARALGQRIRERSAGLSGLVQKRLRDRLERLLPANAPIDQQRLESEVALLADRADISEELSRLDSHFDQLGGLLATSGPVGRKLDFLLQEVARELNTAGAKSQDASVAQLVVESKVEIERMREQVQNVE